VRYDVRTMATSRHQEEMLDEALAQTFPASDVPRVMQVAPAAADEGVGHEQRETRGEFFIERDGARAGRLTYRREGADTVVLVHTEVGEALRGQGAGLRLVNEAVRWARAEHLKIVPHCPFARATFEKHPELRDVLAG
jgi:uncharacterized protein